MDLSKGGAGEGAADEGGLHEPGTDKVGAREVAGCRPDAGEVGATGLHPSQVAAVERRIIDERAAQVGAAEIGCHDHGPVDLCPSEVAAGETGIGELGPHEETTAQVETRQVEADSHELLRVRLIPKPSGVPLEQPLEVGVWSRTFHRFSRLVPVGGPTFPALFLD